MKPLATKGFTVIVRTIAVSVALGALTAGAVLALTPASPASAAPALRTTHLRQTTHADVDGDGRTDTVRISDAGHKEVSGMEWTTWLVRVDTAAGRRSSVSFGIPSYQTTKPWYGSAKLDGRRGAELLFETHSDDGLGLEVLSWRSGTLVREAAPAVPRSAYQPSGWFAPWDGNQIGGYRFGSSHGQRLVNTWNATCPGAGDSGSCTVQTVQSVWRSGAWHRRAQLPTQKVAKKAITRRVPLAFVVVHR